MEAFVETLTTIEIFSAVVNEDSMVVDANIVRKTNKFLLTDEPLLDNT